MGPKISFRPRIKIQVAMPRGTRIQGTNLVQMPRDRGPQGRPDLLARGPQSRLRAKTAVPKAAGLKTQIQNFGQSHFARGPQSRHCAGASRDKARGPREIAVPKAAKIPQLAVPKAALELKPAVPKAASGQKLRSPRPPVSKPRFQKFGLKPAQGASTTSVQYRRPMHLTTRSGRKRPDSSPGAAEV